MDIADLNAFLADPELIELIEQVKTSDDLLDVITLNENQHSDILAWCLSPQEGHGQGDATIKDFLHAACIAAEDNRFDNRRFFDKWTPGRIRTGSFGAAFISREFTIRVEEGSRNGRLDLFLVDPQNQIIVAIENKAGARLSEEQLGRYHAAVKQQIGNRPVFRDYDFAFVVLDRDLYYNYEEEDLVEMGNKWALLDYSWLQNSAKRARHHVERHNNAAALLLAYCQRQTDYCNSTEEKLFERAASLSLRHERVVNALRELDQDLSSWTPSTLLNQGGALTLFQQQQRQLCILLQNAQGLAAVIFQVRRSLSISEQFELEAGRTWFSVTNKEAIALGFDEDDAWWPIYAQVLRKSGDDDSGLARYTVRLVWRNHAFDDSKCHLETLRQHFQQDYPALAKFDTRRVRRIVVAKGLNATAAAAAAVGLAQNIRRLIGSRST
jgi:hypothetical protein